MLVVCSSTVYELVDGGQQNQQRELPKANRMNIPGAGILQQLYKPYGTESLMLPAHLAAAL